MKKRGGNRGKKNSMKKFRTGLVLMVALCIAAGAQTPATDVEAVKTAVANFYSAANDRDVDTLLSYMAPGGYTAFVENSKELIHSNEQSWRELSKTDWVQNFEAIGLEVKVYKDAALVTGLRVGTTARADEEIYKHKAFLTMMWIRMEGQWRLIHLHVFPIPEEE